MNGKYDPDMVKELNPESNGEELDNGQLNQTSGNSSIPKAGSLAPGDYLGGARPGFRDGYNGVPNSNIARGVSKKPVENMPKKDDNKKTNSNNDLSKKDDTPKQNSLINPAKGINPNNMPRSDKKDNGLTNAKNSTDANSNNSKKGGNSGLLSKVGNRLSNLSPVSKARNALGLGGKEGLSNKDDDKGEGNDEKPSAINQGALAPGITIGKFKISIPVLSFFAVLLFLLFILVMFAVLFSTFDDEDDDSMCSSSSSFSGFANFTDVTDFMCKMQSPVANYTVSSKFGFGVDSVHAGRLHSGIDLAVSTGTPVYAAQSGTVVGTDTSGGYGHDVVIDHGNGILTRFAHNSKVLVSKGDNVGKGQKIAEAGSSGHSTGPHGHFEVMKTTVSSIFSGYQDVNAYFINHEEFKQQCGSAWDGEPVGESAQQTKTDSSDGTENNTNDSSSNTYTSTSSGSQCCVTTSSSASGNYCPNGITVTGNDAGTYDLDEYVERVVTAENGGAHPEALKALAIAARTYAINRTNNCESSIPNSTAAQVMAHEASDKVKSALQAVKGSILLYNGNYFSAEYSSFWGDCVGGQCTSTFTRIPSNEKSTYSIPSSYVTISKGHDRGLSQNGSNYMATEQGKTYDEILRFFYADGIEITGASGNTCSLGGSGTFKGGKIWDYNQADYNDAYCGGTIADSGCGPTSMAIVVSTMLNEKHDPPELAKIAADTGHCSTKTSDYFVDAAKKYNLKHKITSDDDEVLAALNRGDSLVIVNVGTALNNYWTSFGHYIVLAGHDGDNVWVQDPNKSTNGSNRTNTKGDGVYSFEQYIKPAAINFKYIIFTQN